jgi:hypothetical protein
MPNVILSREWTDPEGRSHAAGSVVDLDDVTVALLQSEGITGPSDPSEAFTGPSVPPEAFRGRSTSPQTFTGPSLPPP